MALINPTKKKRKILTPKGSKDNIITNKLVDSGKLPEKERENVPQKPVKPVPNAPEVIISGGQKTTITRDGGNVSTSTSKIAEGKKELDTRINPLTGKEEGSGRMISPEEKARLGQKQDAEDKQRSIDLRDDTAQERIDLTNLEFKQKVNTMRAKIKRDSEAAEAFRLEGGQQRASQTAAIESQFSEGRGGVTTSSAGLAGGVFKQQVIDRGAKAARQFQAMRSAITSAENALSIAIEDKDLRGREDAIEQIDNNKRSLKKMEDEQAEREAENTKTVLDFAKQTGALANSSDDDLLGYAEQTGIPVSMFVNAREADKQALTAKGLDQIKARQEATMRQLEIESFADSKMSPELRLIRERQSLVDGGATQSTIDAFDNKAGLSPNMKVIKGEGNTFFGYTPDGQFINLTPGASDSFYPTGELKQAEFAGRKVTLDSSALATVAEINSQLVSTGLGEMVIYSSTRDQASTIASMVTEYNQDNPDSIIEVSPGDLSSLNAAAITLSNRGRPVAQVGHSLHEQGRAIDIPGGKIATYKPLLQANGWQQSTDPNDSGHFNFIGTEKPRQPEPVLKTKEQADNWNFGKRTQQGNLTLRQLEDEFIFDKVGVKTVGEDIGQFDIEEAIDEFTISFGGLNLEFDLLGFDDLSVKVPNVWKNVNEQKYDQATSNFLNAVLRKESGAAISTGEFKSGEAQYFPAPGDTLETIKQKRRNRQLVVDNLFQSSGNSKLQPQALSKLQSINLADIASKQQREDASTLLQVSDPSQQLNANDIPLPINRGQE